MTVANSTISGNYSHHGGGIYNSGTAAVAGSSHIDGNTGWYGGGIENASYATFTITDSTISGNSVIYNCGGILNNGVLNITDASVNDNYTANKGGGIYNHSVDRGGAWLTVSNSTISGNICGPGGRGGGIFIDSPNYIPITITDSTISGNSASSGAGIYNNSSTLSLTHCTLSGNSAGGGGGILNQFGNLTIDNSTLSGNSADGYGGAISNYNSGPLTLIDCTISGNSAENAGGGIYGTATLQGTIVANSTDGGDLTGSFDGTYNVIGDSSGGLSDESSTNISGDPLLAPLGDYGGTTETMPLLPGSPAYGAGSTFNDSDDNPITTDQRGLPRPRGSAYDIGAFQVQAVTVATAAAASPSSVTGTTTNLSVLGAANDGESRLTYTWATTGSQTYGSYDTNGNLVYTTT